MRRWWLVVGVVGVAAQDALWLRYTPVPEGVATSLYGALRGAEVTCVSDEEDDLRKVDPSRHAVLDAVKSELAHLEAMVGSRRSRGGRPSVVVNVSARAFSSLGDEGFRVLGGGVGIEAATGSGALYGAFRLLGFVQRREPLPATAYESAPAMRLRQCPEACQRLSTEGPSLVPRGRTDVCVARVA